MLILYQAAFNRNFLFHFITHVPTHYPSCFIFSGTRTQRGLSGGTGAQRGLSKICWQEQICLPLYQRSVSFPYSHKHQKCYTLKNKTTKPNRHKFVLCSILVLQGATNHKIQQHNHIYMFVQLTGPSVGIHDEQPNQIYNGTVSVVDSFLVKSHSTPTRHTTRTRKQKEQMANTVLILRRLLSFRSFSIRSQTVVLFVSRICNILPQRKRKQDNINREKPLTTTIRIYAGLELDINFLYPTIPKYYFKR